MYEEARRINDYLPIEPGAESRYILHLWGAFEALIEKEDSASAFSILPFHLLFMLAVQYKVYRISAWKNEEYFEAFNDCRVYNKADREIIIANAPIISEDGVIPSGSSVRNLSKIYECHLFRFFKIIDIADSVIPRAKILIDIRGSYAHANGNIEEGIEERVDEYLKILNEIQDKCLTLNNDLAAGWLSEYNSEETPQEFAEKRLLGSHLCPEDFKTGLLEANFPIFD
jgi:hypothetical protein